MKYPKFIQHNSCIGIPSPSDGANNKLKENKLLKAKENLENIGYKLIISNNLLNSHNGRSADKYIRAKEINDMFQNKNIDLILCASGGEFLVEILPYINFDLLKNNPKYVCGFSDPTGLLYPITTKYDIATIYGQNFSSFGQIKLDQSQKDFLNIINSKQLNEKSYNLYEDEPFEKITGLEEYNLKEKVYWHTLDNKEVSLKGRIIGGCLDIITNLASTKYDGTNEFNEKYKDDGIIWYFDNCELSMEETIRTLWKLNELNYFKYTKCIIFGRFGISKTYYNYDVKTCLKDSVVNELNIPIIYDADISHKPPCLTIINGAIAKINVKNGKCNITYILE